MRTYRVAKVDGTYDLISANNIEQAISIARNKYGQLPNDINKKIVNQIDTILHEITEQISNYRESVSQSVKELDWNSVYVQINKLMLFTDDKQIDIRNKLGSMVKIK